MKKTLTMILVAGTLALTSISVFAVDKTPLSIGEDLEFVVPDQQEPAILDKEVTERPCGLEVCTTYGECGNYEDCLNGPKRDGSGKGMMRGLGNGQGQGRGQGRNCCR